MSGTDDNSVDRTAGYCVRTKTFHSLRPKSPIPPPSLPISVTDFLSIKRRQHSTHSTDFIIDAVTDRRLSYHDFLSLSNSLAVCITSRYPSISKSDVAFIITPDSLHVPVLYFALLSLGVVISPASPLGSTSDVEHQLTLTRPSIAFASSETALKLPRERFPLRVVLIDSPEFSAMMTEHRHGGSNRDRPLLENVNGVVLSDAATVLYSSGTTGRMKGVVMSHRSMIGGLAQSYNPIDQTNDKAKVFLLPIPLFHVYGLFMVFKGFAEGATLVILTDRKKEKFQVEGLMKLVDKYRVNTLLASPPVVVAMLKLRSEDSLKHCLRSLEVVRSGGAPLGKEVSTAFEEKFPWIALLQGYALTESLLGSAMEEDWEAKRHGSVGRLAGNMEAKIVDPSSGEALPPGLHGELWLRGPAIMTGYLGDDKATAETLDSDGWLKTGDLCYFDNHGFLFIVDRLKEMIKYKAYQVPPAELETLLQSNPEIADAAVVPYPDDEAGQIPMAFVVRRPGSTISEHRVMDFIAQQVAPYKKIRLVSFVASIPKTPSGKILRRVLRELAMGASKL